MRRGDQPRSLRSRGRSTAASTLSRCSRIVRASFTTVSASSVTPRRASPRGRWRPRRSSDVVVELAQLPPRQEGAVGLLHIGEGRVPLCGAILGTLSGAPRVPFTQRPAPLATEPALPAALQVESTDTPQYVAALAPPGTCERFQRGNQSQSSIRTTKQHS
jgi:hypothetical protein